MTLKLYPHLQVVREKRATRERGYNIMARDILRNRCVMKRKAARKIVIRLYGYCLTLHLLENIRGSLSTFENVTFRLLPLKETPISILCINFNDAIVVSKNYLLFNAVK